MREIDKIAEGLFEKIRDRYEDVSLGDENAKATSDPEKARFFNFDYIVDGENHGNITMSIIDESSLKVYFSKNISKELSEEERHDWYSFLRELREFARRNLLSFEPRDITRSTLKHRDIQQQSKADSTYGKDEVVAESKLYGTSKSSYQKFGPARIIVRHNRHVTDESVGQRSRYINSVYVENHEGERFKMPFKSLTASRAMARHISAGGTPHDDLGQHICEMAEECGKLKPFLNNVRHRMFEDEETKTMVEAAFEYHKLLKNTLQRMSGKKGYTACKEQFVHTSTSYVPEDDVDLNEIKERFVKRVFNEKMEDALPLVHKAYNMKKENKFTEQFENWATAISEGTWALPQTEEDKQKLIDILSKELPVGVDALNATDILYNVFGDDKLFDSLGELADVDPKADARDEIMWRLQEVNPQMYQAILDAIGDQDAPEPATDTEGGEIDEGNTYGASDSGIDGIVYENDYCDACDHTAEQCVCEERDIEDSEQVCVYCGEPRDDKMGCCDENHWVSKKEFDQDNVNEEHDDTDQDDLLANTEAIQSAIVRRILNDIGRHSELLKKAGPDGVMNASLDVASFHAPMEEIGTSDISAMVREVYNEVGVEYPEPEREVDNTLEEAFERLLNEDTINVGDIIHDKTQPEIEGRVIRVEGTNYIINVEGEEYHVAQANAEKIPKALHEADSRFMAYLEPLIGQRVYLPAEGKMGTIVGPSLNTNLPAGIQAKLDNGQMITTAPGRFKAERPGPLQQAIDKFNAITGKIDPIPAVAKSYGTVAGPMDNLHKQDWSKVSEDDVVNKDEKLKRMGAKPLSTMDKLKNIPQGFKAAVQGKPEDDLSLYNQRKSSLEEMMKLAGLK